MKKKDRIKEAIKNALIFWGFILVLVTAGFIVNHYYPAPETPTVVEKCK